MTKGLLSLLGKLSRDEGGSIFFQFFFFLIAMMGMIGLALSGGRLLMLHTDLHKLADAAALAGAAKLNGTADALTNADTAARAVVNNVHWADVAGAQILSGTSGVQFYSSLNPDTVTTDPKAAKFIKVSTGSWQVAASFVSAVSVIAGGTISNDSARASAVAKGPNGGGTAACYPQSMMLCNPSEQVGGTGDTSTFNPTPGTMFVFSVQGNTGSMGPGNFNLLDTPSGSGSDADIKDFLSQQNQNFCSTTGTSPAQGQKQSALRNGINVRFDQQPQGNTSGMDLTSAPIKITGLSGSCNPAQLNDVSALSPPLPRDSILPPPDAGSTSIGNGVTVAQLQAYWDLHHGGTLPGGITTRYQVYSAEVPTAQGGTGGGQSWLPASDAAEPHGPVCAPSGTMVSPTYNLKRRVLKVAVVDCLYWGVQGNAVNNIPQNTFAEFFITEAVTSGGYLYTEFVAKRGIDDGTTTGIGGCGAGGGLCSIVQLVR